MLGHRRYYFKRQKETKGLADAIYRAKSFVGDEPFAILYGDDVIDAEYPVTKQLTDVYEKFGNGVVGVQEVPREDVPKYCTLDVTPLERTLCRFTICLKSRRSPRLCPAIRFSAEL